MGTPRRRRHSQQTRVTQEAVDAYRAGDSLTLSRLLRLPPWQISPLDAEGECPYSPQSGCYDLWPDSVALRQELEAWEP